VAHPSRKPTLYPAPPADIADVYQKLYGEELAENGVGYCPNPNHGGTGVPDTRPNSCKYERDEGVYVCRACEVGGNVYRLIRDRGGISKGSEHAWLVEQGLALGNDWNAATIYSYCNAAGAPVYEVGRWTPKHFAQRVPDPKSKTGWKSGPGVLSHVERVPYRLPELLDACKRRETVYVVEGEKDADRLRLFGLTATTNAQGAGWAWPITWASYFTGAARVVVIADADSAGERAARWRAGIAARAVADTRIVLRLPRVGEKGDATDFIEAGGTRKELETIGADAPTVEPYNPPYPEDAAERLRADLTDTGAGRWFSDTVGVDFHFLADEKRWYQYVDGTWTPRANPTAATASAVDLMKLAATESGDVAFLEFAEDARSMLSRKNMLDAAREHRTRYSSEFNRGGTLLAVANGVLDLTTGALRDHQREDLITFKSPVPYDPAAVAPHFEALLADATSLPDNTRRPVLQEYVELMLGGALGARTTQRRCYFLCGPKGSRKSTVIRVLEAILDGYATAIDYRALSEGGHSSGEGPSPSTAKMRAKRLVVASEARIGDRIDVAKIKRLIGGDKVSARHLHAEDIEFRFEGTLILTGNEVPTFNGDDSFWEKFKPVPFDNPLPVEDPEFEDRELMPELPGILALLVRAYGRLRDAGFKVADPLEVIELRKQQRDEQDPLREFIADCIVVDPKGKVEVADLRRFYAEWCDRLGCHALGPRKLSNQLKQNHKWQQRESNGRTRSQAESTSREPSDGRAVLGATTEADAKVSASCVVAMGAVLCALMPGAEGYRRGLFRARQTVTRG
jgi:P4 family phage/plasmid primase-like protien